MHEFRLLLLYINRFIFCSSYFLLSAPSSSLFHFYINITVYHGIRASHSSANNTSTLEGSVVALITNSHKCARMYIGVAPLKNPMRHPMTIFFVCFCWFGFLESPPSILVTRNPNWFFRDSKARDWLRKGKVLWHDQKLDVFSQVQECRSNK